MPDLTDKAKSLLIVQIICAAVASLIVALRIGAKPYMNYIRAKKKQVTSNKSGDKNYSEDVNRLKKDTITADDLLMYLAFLLYLIQSVAAIYGILAGGIGAHAADLTISKIIIAARMWYICEAVNGALTALIRTSVSVYLLRVIPFTDTIGNLCRTRTVIIAGLGIMYLFVIIYSLINIFQCTPLDYYWTQFESYKEGASCRLSRVVPMLTIIHSAVACACDLAIAGISAKVMFKAQISLRKKISIISLLSLGVVAGIVMIIRIPYIKILEISTDFLYQTVDVGMWSIIEPSLGIVAGCLPTIYSLYLAITQNQTKDFIAQPEIYKSFEVKFDFSERSFAEDESHQYVVQSGAWARRSMLDPGM
ncbi:hypothetical protein GGI35DRAFT_463826 [Trichoderma velutinum]